MNSSAWSTLTTAMIQTGTVKTQPGMSSPL